MFAFFFDTCGENNQANSIVLLRFTPSYFSMRISELLDLLQLSLCDLLLITLPTLSIPLLNSRTQGYKLGGTGVRNRTSSPRLTSQSITIYNHNIFKLSYTNNQKIEVQWYCSMSFDKLQNVLIFDIRNWNCFIFVSIFFFPLHL